MIDRLLDRTRSSDYTCQHFAREVWLALTNEDIMVRAERLMNGRLSKSEVRRFERLDRPRPPCFVVCTQFNHDPHVGVLLKRDCVIHLGKHIPQIVSLTYFVGAYNDTRFYR